MTTATEEVVDRCYILRAGTRDEPRYYGGDGRWAGDWTLARKFQAARTADYFRSKVIPEEPEPPERMAIVGLKFMEMRKGRTPDGYAVVGPIKLAGYSTAVGAGREWPAFLKAGVGWEVLPMLATVFPDAKGAEIAMQGHRDARVVGVVLCEMKEETP